MTKFNERKKADPATETLPLPVGVNLKTRYRRIQNDFDKRKLGSLHLWARERIDQLLDEAEKFLADAG